MVKSTLSNPANGDRNTQAKPEEFEFSFRSFVGEANADLLQNPRIFDVLRKMYLSLYSWAIEATKEHDKRIELEAALKATKTELAASQRLNAMYEKALESEIDDKHELSRTSAQVLIATEFARQASSLDAADKSHENQYDTLLTELFNANGAFLNLERECANAALHEHDVGVVFCDANGFKELNDTRGHQMGNEGLLRLQALFIEFFKDHNDVVVARMGGDEFCLIFPQYGPEKTKKIITQLAKRIDEDTVLKEFGITLSFGIANFSQFQGADQLFHEADLRMYDAKRKMKLSTPRDKWHSCLEACEAKEQQNNPSLPGTPRKLPPDHRPKN